MKTQTTPILFLLILSMLGCIPKIKYEDAITFKKDRFGKEILLFPEDSLELFCYPTILAIYGDSLLFINGAKNQQVISLINLEKSDQIHEFIMTGQGPEDMLSCKGISIRADDVWFFDKRANRIIKYKATDFLKEEAPKPVSSIHIEDNLVDNATVIQDKIFANSYSRLNSRFSVYNLSGTFSGEYGKMPDYGVDYTGQEFSEAYQGRMAISGDTVIFFAYANTDLIEKYDTKGHLLKRTHGPDQFFPSVKSIHSNNYTKVVSVEGEAKSAYECPIIVGNELWVLYSGQIMDSSKPNYFLKNEMLVFDLDLNPLRRYYLKSPIYSFNVRKDKKEIYGLTVAPEMQIIKYHY